MAQVAPASAAAISPSGNGKKASLATALPFSESPASFAFQTAMREASTRDIWPASTRHRRLRLEPAHRRRQNADRSLVLLLSAASTTESAADFFSSAARRAL